MSEYKAQAPQTELLNWKDTLKTKAKKTIGVTALAGAVMIGGNACAQEQIPKIETSITDIETAQPASLSSEQIENLSSNTFIDLPETVRIDALADYLKTDKAEANSFFGDYLNENEESVFTAPDLSKSPEHYSPQEILNNYTLGIWDASVQGDSLEDVDRGRKLLSIVMDPSYKNFESTSAKIGNGKGGIIDVYSELPMDYDSKVSSTTFMGHEIGTAGGDIILGKSLSNNEKIIFLFTNLSTSNGKLVSVLTDTFKPSAPEVNDALNKLDRSKLATSQN